jgi:hypothetical protein
MDLTTEVGIGVAATVDRIAPGTEVSRTETRVGVTIPSVGFGAFVTPDLALLARVTNTAVHQYGAFSHQTLVGGGAQYWITDHVNVAGTFGAAFLGRGVLAGLGRHQQTGFGFDLRLGVPLARADRHVLGAFFAWTPTWYSESLSYVASNMHTLTVGIDWQLDRER